MRLIDADALKDWECEKCEYEHKNGYWCRESCGVMQRIDESPTIDAVPIVRCKDCVCRGENKEKGYKYCMFAGWLIQDDDFCSHGERLDENAID